MRKLLGLTLSVCLSLSGLAIGARADERDPSAADALRHAVVIPGLTADADWRVHLTDHFLVAFDRDEARAVHQGDLLEATHRRFYETLGTPAFGVTPVADRLVCLYFDDKAAYLRYARRVDRVDMAWTVAYYSARTNRVAFYRYGRETSDGGRPDANATPAEQLYGSAASDDQTPREKQIALASATHEAAHQLAFNSGLQKRGVMYPLWVSEGLATNFELHAPEGGFGPDHDNATRRSRLLGVYRRGGLESLHAFVTTTRVPTDDARATDALYAQAWGLFHFLYENHREALAEYLATLRDLPRGNRDRATLRAEFTDHFGSIERLETEWRNWVTALDEQH